jgi:hypothetical protein
MKKRANPDSEANIRRIDSKPKAKKQTHGFQVHFLRGTEAVTKMFSDTVYGGKELARRAARKFKKDSMRDLPERIFRGPIAAEGTRGGVKKSGGQSRGARGVKSSSRTRAGGGATGGRARARRR